MFGALCRQSAVLAAPGRAASLRAVRSALATRAASSASNVPPPDPADEDTPPAGGRSSLSSIVNGISFSPVNTRTFDYRPVDVDYTQARGASEGEEDPDEVIPSAEEDFHGADAAGHFFNENFHESMFTEGGTTPGAGGALQTVRRGPTRMELLLRQSAEDGEGYDSDEDDEFQIVNAMELAFKSGDLAFRTRQQEDVIRARVNILNFLATFDALVRAVPSEAERQRLRKKYHHDLLAFNDALLRLLRYRMSE
ncbi:hypothetical protein H696_02618 [Fonticula alba]|uniref:Uncharacterized protein n=1 Tax=Fonticula alba TaxID=691883 RepID=A0A058Z8N4_FONAL|nr:hypothetical protein H696_02618 [Fonticula alba]KCV70288.1 hypothetical protein H696_02618 [Fonticula alba]|eukprot:XP_009494804.1 hypothetical protein H696_02618 [Fonticula alba]